MKIEGRGSRNEGRGSREHPPASTRRMPITPGLVASIPTSRLTALSIASSPTTLDPSRVLLLGSVSNILNLCEHEGGLRASKQSTRTHPHTHACMHARTHARTHAHTHTHTHTKGEQGMEGGARARSQSSAGVLFCWRAAKAVVGVLRSVQTALGCCNTRAGLGLRSQGIGLRL